MSRLQEKILHLLGLVIVPAGAFGNIHKIIHGIRVVKSRTLFKLVISFISRDIILIISGGYEEKYWH